MMYGATDATTVATTSDARPLALATLPWLAGARYEAAQFVCSSQSALPVEPSLELGENRLTLYCPSTCDLGAATNSDRDSLSPLSLFFLSSDASSGSSTIQIYLAGFVAYDRLAPLCICCCRDHGIEARYYNGP